MNENECRFAVAAAADRSAVVVLPKTNEHLLRIFLSNLSALKPYAGHILGRMAEKKKTINRNRFVLGRRDRCRTAHLGRMLPSKIGFETARKNLMESNVTRYKC